MCRPLMFIVAALAAASISAAGPQSMPVGPSTQPAASVQTSLKPTLLVLPIEAPPGTYAWVGRAIQQDMLVDLTQMTRAHVIAPAAAPAPDSDAALRAAREARADYVVFGAAQNSGPRLRVTGQVLDVRTGNSLGNLKATAPADDLFPLEDGLAMQVARTLPAGLAVIDVNPQSNLPTVVNGSPYVSQENPSPQYQSVPDTGPDYYSSTPLYSPDYPYVYPDYGYPVYGGFGWWGPSIIIGGGHFHDHFGHDHFGNGFRSFPGGRFGGGFSHGGAPGHGGGFGGHAGGGGGHGR